MKLRFFAAATAMVACGGIADAGLDSGSGDDASTTPDSGTIPDATTSDGTTPIDATPIIDTGPTFTPASLSNIVLWLDAEHLVKVDGSGNISTWGDLTSNKNDATQVTATYAPTLVSNGINSLPTVHFDSAGQSAHFLQIADATSLQWGTGDFAVAIVARYTNDPKNGDSTGSGMFFWKSTFVGNYGAGVALWANVPLANSSVVDGFVLVEDQPDYVYSTSVYHDNVARLYLARRSGSTMEIRVNGTSTATQTQTNTVDVSAVYTPVSIGVIDYTYYRLFGDISEIVALKGATTPTDLSSLEAYFKAKYAL